MTADEQMVGVSKNQVIPPETISAVIITKNADRTLEACLDGLKWATEIII